MADTPRTDPVLISTAAAIFAVLFLMAYLLFSLMSMIAIAVGGGLVAYQVLTLRGRTASKFKSGVRFPSSFLIFLIGSPIVLGIVVGYDAYSFQNSIVKGVLLWGLTMTFWSTLLFVPLSMYSKMRESELPEPDPYPKITILVPAYNEEKVIEKTIQGLLETRYPNKEIIVIDDGSKDSTFQIISKYKHQIKALHKDNGGKASAINFGLAYATGEIIVVVDADTIIGPDSLIYLARGFYSDENVAAVAGNIKVRNRRNWLTWCQAVEYVAGIQIVRRAFDLFGAISVVPGSLGAFRRSVLEEVGTYHKDTLVEDFDVTLKILKTKLVIAGSTKATAYTEAPETLTSLYMQRRRWYGGNLQVFSRHFDTLFNPRFGILQRLVFPYMLFSSVVMPFVGFLTIASAIYAAFLGNGLLVLEVFSIFTVLQALQVLLAVRMDDEDPKLVFYGIFLVVGFKQILDFLLISAMFRKIFKKEMIWTSAKRVGYDKA
ncbi:MAG TPA: glycosyltransferase [Candidatus Nitrosotalea sp.]|nr:glycosyltransferase [Candidatus Nitrosotalea sp.]